MTPDEFAAAAAPLWGGVRDDIQNGTDFTAECAAAQGTAEAGERHRRDLAAQRPGYGAVVALPEPPSGPATGKYDAVGPPVGEGYAVPAPEQPQQVVSDHGPLAYGQRPVYAGDLVGGYQSTGGRSEPAIGQRGQPADGGIVVASAGTPRRGLLARLLGRRR